MTTQIKAGVIAANAITASELASSALSGGSFTGDVTFDTDTLVVDSANSRVGIGTTSPSTKLHVSSATTTKSVVETSGTVSDALIEFTRGQGSGNSWSIGLDQSASSALSFAYLSNGSPSLTSHSKMVIDSSGNVGIGTSSPSYKLHVVPADNDGIIIDSSSDSHTGFLYFGDATSNTVGAISYDHFSDAMRFKVNAAEKMRIDSSGNVGIGTSSPSSNLHVKNVASNAELKVETAGGLDARLILDAPAASGAQSQIFFDADGTTAGSIQYTHNSGGTNFMTFHTGGSNTERMRIDSSGTVIFKGGTTDNAIQIWQNNSEIARIGGSSGTLNFLVGSTTESRMSINSSGGVGIATTCATNRKLHVLGITRCEATQTSNTYMIEFLNPNGDIGSIQGSGTSVTYVTSSDYRLKENIQPLTNGLERVQQLNPVQFDWKVDGTSSEGFIAHEVQEIFSDAIVGEKDGEKMQGMDYGRITPLLVKAIQEQQVLIEQLQAEVALLKGE